MAKKDTIHALERRGVSTETAERLADADFTLTALKKASLADLTAHVDEAEARATLEALGLDVEKATAKPTAKKKAAKPKAEAAAEEAPPEEGAPAKEAPPKAAEPVLLLFGRWDLTEVEVADAGLRRYMNLTPTFLPHTGGRWANRPYAKERVNLVERLVNHMMRTEKYTGKKGKTIQAVEKAFAEVEQRTKRNPVQVLVDALQNASPREEITRLRFGGISVPRAVDIAPARRLDLALRHLTVGAVQSTYKNPKPVWRCLADEMILAAEGDINSFAVGKKEELERVAASAR